MIEKVKVIIVDDNRAILHELANYLQGQGDIEISGIAENAREASELIRLTRPDIRFNGSNNAGKRWLLSFRVSKGRRLWV